MLYPGKGINASAKLIVPETKIVTAMSISDVQSSHAAKFTADLAIAAVETISIRSAHRQDIPALCQLYHELHEFTVRGVPQRLQSLGDVECFDASSLSLSLQKLIDAVDVAIWVAEINEQVIGLAEVYLREDEQNEDSVVQRYGYLQSLVVKHQLRGRGIGVQLLDAAEAWVRSKGATELRLDIWEFDQGPLGFYERQDYRTLRRTLVRQL